MIKRKLRINDNVTAEEGYGDMVADMARKPFPAIAGLRNIQRLLKGQNPRIGDINLEELVDARFMRKLDESGFIDRLYATPGR